MVLFVWLVGFRGFVVVVFSFWYQYCTVLVSMAWITYFEVNYVMSVKLHLLINDNIAVADLCGNTHLQSQHLEGQKLIKTLRPA